MDDQLERLRVALADRYDVERELGRGGMATVHLAHDRKHDRRVAIKVLRPELAASLGTDRFLREIQVAAGLQHPHILPLHDSGEANGLLYYVMPYIEGESLRDRLTREQFLPLEEALRIASDVAEALDCAHRHGTVHRDIKPENILLSGGHAIVSDFGIARAVSAAGPVRLTGTGVAVGTPAYMSPEQAAASDRLDARSDLYSLGCVLYEMLGGQPPFSGVTPEAVLARHAVDPVPSIRTVRATVPTVVEQVVLRLLAKVPADRYASAADVLAALRAASAPAPEGRRRARLTWLGSAVAVVVASSIIWLRPSRGIAFAERDWVLIADLDNQTGEAVFDRSLAAALGVGLQQSRYANVFPRARVRETLRRMGRSDTAVIDEAVGADIAQRENLRAVIVPSIARIDSVYLLTTRIVDPVSRVDLRSENERARGRPEVLDALDRLVRRLRRDLGESRLAVARRSLPLAQATTSSLEALKRLSDGAAAWTAGHYPEAAASWQAALQLDSNFAWAHASLGGYYYFNNNRPKGELHFKRALNLLDRLTERERLWIQAQAAGWRGQRDSAAGILRVFLRDYPDDRDAWYNLGNDLMWADRCTEAITAYSRALQIDARFANAHINIATCYGKLQDPARAVPAYLKAFELQPEFATQGNLNHEFGFTYAKLGKTAQAESVFMRMMAGGPVQRATGLRSLALLDFYQGKYRLGIARLRQALVLRRAAGMKLSEYRDHLFLAAAYRMKGMANEQRVELRSADRLRHDVPVEPFFLLLEARMHAWRGDPQIARALLTELVARVNPGDHADEAAAHQLRGEIALVDGHSGDAIPELELAYQLESDALRGGALAHGLALSGDTARAIAQYQALIERGKDLGWEAQEEWLIAHYWLARLFQEQATTDEAIRRYRAFLDLWKDADADIPIRRDAQERLQRLLQSERP